MAARKRYVSPLQNFKSLPLSPCINKTSNIRKSFKGFHSRNSAITQNASTSSSVIHKYARPSLIEVNGQSGKLYKVERMIQDRAPKGRVFLAREGNKKYILKEIPSYNWSIYKEVYDMLETHPHIRDLADTAPDQSIFIFDYLEHDFLDLVQKDLSLATTKQILKQALQGLAAMHARDIVHNDVKPNNIFVTTLEGSEGLTVQRTILADLEDSAHCPPPGNLIGAQLGNWMWRSPEAHAEGPMNKPSDIFAFAIVCIYAITKRMIFYVADEKLDEGIEPLAIVLQRQLSYFSDPDMFDGFQKYVAEKNPNSPWIGIFHLIQNDFDAETPREPFALWEEDPPFDEQFRDLILQMTRFDPRRRITAHEALDHAWFNGA